MSADWETMYQLKGDHFLAETVEANSGWLQEYIHPEDQPRVQATIKEAIRTKSVFDLEHRVRQSNGGIGWTHSRAVPVLNEAGQIEEWFGMASDVTAKKIAADVLIKNEKLAAMGRLAASIAHEVNNPLESVTNLLYLARNSEDLAEVRTFLDLADQELTRAIAISNQTLRFHKQSSKPTTIDLTLLLTNVLLVHRGRISNAKILVEERFRGDDPVQCFEGEIRQVLSNLVGNATDAMQSYGGGRLLVPTRKARSWKTGQQGMVMTVADTGCGMSSETQSKVFEAFYTTKGMEGTGLGLWVSKEIVDRHHGEFRVRSSRDPRHHGTVFQLYLPNAAVSRQLL